MSETAVVETPTTPAATTTVAEPWYKDWIQSDGSLNAKALDRLPEHLKPLKETWSRQKTIDDIGVSSAHFQSLASKKALSPLIGTETKEVIAERKAHLDAMNGVPKTAKEYGITKPADLPDNAWDQELVDSFVSWAHENSIAPGALKKLINEVQAPTVKKRLAGRDETVSQYYAGQDKTFGETIKRENIPADRAASLVEKGAIALGLDLANEDTKNLLKRADARLMAMRHAVAIGEDSVVQGDGKGTSETNPGELADDAVRNPANPLNGPYWNKESKYSRAAHDAAVARVNEWRKLAAAKGPQVIDRRRK